MYINALNNITPDEPEKNKKQEPQKYIPLNSVFIADSEGGEEITDTEYEKLSANDKAIVDGYRNLIERYIGKDAKITWSNVQSAEQLQKREVKEIIHKQVLKDADHNAPKFGLE